MATGKDSFNHRCCVGQACLLTTLLPLLTPMGVLFLSFSFNRTGVKTLLFT